MRLRCELAVPSGFRQGRVLVRLLRPEPDLLLLLPAGGLGESTAWAWMTHSAPMTAGPSMQT